MASYVGFVDLYADRTEQLRPYGITCTCPPCQHPVESDKRRRRITQLRHTIAQFPPTWKDVSAGAQLDTMIRSSVELMRNVELEGVQVDAGLYISAAMQAYNAYLALGDVKMVCKYTQELVVAAKLNKVSKKRIQVYEGMADMQLLVADPCLGRGKHLVKEIEASLKGEGEVFKTTSELEVLD